jgi:hypothetical protein
VEVRPEPIHYPFRGQNAGPLTREAIYTNFFTGPFYLLLN